jgi:hypothetical protein
MLLGNEQYDKISHNGFLLQEEKGNERNGENGNEDIPQQANNRTENIGDH